MKKLILLLLIIFCSSAFAEVKNISGTTNVEDTHIWSGANADKNYGGHPSIWIAGTTLRGIIRVKNVASELGPGMIVTGCVLYLYCYDNVTNGDYSIYRVFKPWVEGTQEGGTNPPGATWPDWNNDVWEWGTAGCDNADDGGSDNKGDGSGADRKATAEDIQTVNAEGWYGWDISVPLAQGWYDGSIGERGVIVIGSDGIVQNYFRSSEHLNEPVNNPYWEFTYEKEVRRRRDLTGGN